jgi:hypothetical protein
MIKDLVKIFDKQIAVALNDGGFPYIGTEQCGGETVYIFEFSQDLWLAYEEVAKDGEFAAKRVIVDTVFDM